MVEIRNGAWLDAREFPPVHWIVPGIIPEGQTLLVAPPKAGKSWLVYAIAIARATGGLVLGQRIQPGPVLYLALEDGWRRLQERARKLLAPDETIPKGIDYAIQLEPGTVITTIRDWISQHVGRNPLVIVDTFGKIKPSAKSGTGAYEHDYAVMAQLKALIDAEPGSAMVLVHHDRKAASDDFVDSVSGTNGIAGAADTTVVISRARTQDEAVLSITGRDVIEAEYAATFDGGYWRLNGADLLAARQAVATMRAAKNLGEDAADIVAYIANNPAGVKASEVADAVGIDPHKARTYLQRLAERGRITRATRGLYTPVASVASVASDGEFQPDATLATDATAVFGGAA